MTRGPLLAKLLSPTGFVLVALSFTLPFVVVSCDAGDGAKATATYTGIDLARGSKATISATTVFEDGYARQVGGTPPTVSSIQGKHIFPIGVQPLILAVAALLLAGLASEALRNRTARAVAATSAAGCAAIVLIYAETAARSATWTLIDTDSQGKPIAPDDAQLKLLSIHTGYGFWIALALLLIIGAGNFADILRQTRQPPALAAPAGDPVDAPTDHPVSTTATPHTDEASSTDIA